MGEKVAKELLKNFPTNVDDTPASIEEIAFGSFKEEPFHFLDHSLSAEQFSTKVNSARNLSQDDKHDILKGHQSNNQVNSVKISYIKNGSAAYGYVTTVRNTDGTLDVACCLHQVDFKLKSVITERLHEKRVLGLTIYSTRNWEKSERSLSTEDQQCLMNYMQRKALEGFTDCVPSAHQQPNEQKRRRSNTDQISSSDDNMSVVSKKSKSEQSCDSKDGIGISSNQKRKRKRDAEHLISNDDKDGLSTKQSRSDCTKVCVVYCKDITLDSTHGLSADGFCRYVLQLANVLSLCGSIHCYLDIYEEEPQQNWDLWMQGRIKESSFVVLVCSPMLYDQLHHISSGYRNSVSMYTGMFYSDSMVNSICSPKFVPVFLNKVIPQSTSLKEWLPLQLHGATHFVLKNLAKFYISFVQDTAHEMIHSNLEKGLSDPRYDNLAAFIRYLRNEYISQPEPPQSPVKLSLSTIASSTASPTTLSTPYPPRGMSTSNPQTSSNGTVLQNFSDHLKCTYGNEYMYSSKTAGPFKGPNQTFISLALVKKQGINENDAMNDEFLKDSLHGLIEDIYKKKVEIKESDIFKYQSYGGRKVVLIEGSPGVGKTMLASKLCKDWASGETLTEYNMVILVILRRFQHETSKLTITDLIGCYVEDQHAQDISESLQKSNGDKVLFIFEGWDELHPDLRREMSLFSDIITGNKLPKASVMVTSRPTVTDTLYDYMDERHIEILGFRSKQIDEYVKFNYPDKAEMILEHLKKFPNLRALAHIPLTLSIMCNIIKVEQVLPATLTELYDKYTSGLLFAADRKESQSLKNLESIDDLHNEDMKRTFKQLCHVALEGFKQKRFVFTSKDFGSDLSCSFDGYGLLSAFSIRCNAGHKSSYQFIHLSVQEFLAAYQIRELSDVDQIELLKEHRDDKQLQNVWKFLAGITKLKHEAFRDAIIRTTNSSNKSQLFLLHCLYEATDQQVYRVAAEEMNWKLNLNNKSLNTTDCLCAAYIVTSAGGKWNMDLRGCNIGADGLGVIGQHFISQQEQMSSDSNVFSIMEFNLTHNLITLEACHHLVNLLRNGIHISMLNLASNKFKDEGTKLLLTSLLENETVTSLQFSQCGLTSQSGKILGQLMEENSSLKDFGCTFEDLGDEGVLPLAKALMRNNTLTELTLTRTGLGIECVTAIQEAMAINSTLQIIRLDRNNLKVAECKLIARVISENNSLVLIDMSKNPIGNAGFDVLLDALIAKPKSSLVKLGVFHCGITCEGLPKLVRLFRVTETFKAIQLGGNAIGDKGAEYIGEAMTANTSQSVVKISLENTGITETAKADLEKIRKTLDREELAINYVPNSFSVEKRRKK